MTEQQLAAVVQYLATALADTLVVDVVPSIRYRAAYIKQVDTLVLLPDSQCS